MPSSPCVLCKQLSETLDRDGLCATCHDRSAQTRAADAAAHTLTREPPGDTTRTDGGGGEFAGLLPLSGYEYLETLGEGGMGVVYKAVRVSTGQTVAIKKLKAGGFTPGGLRRFVAEAKALALLDDPNVVRLHDFVPDPADPFIVMDFVPGESLGAHLKVTGPLHPDRAARLVAAAARGVQAAHDKGVVHRDLKPANLLVTPDGRVKVVDFGLGKRTAEVDTPAVVGVAAGVEQGGLPGDSITRPGHSAGGTPGFMSPEQVDTGVGPTDRPADVWGLGACLYALLTARPPFPAAPSEMGRVLTDPLVPPHEVNPHVPADLSAIAGKCLHKDPTGRYPSAAAVADDLDRYLSRDITTARPRPLPARVWQRLRRTPRGVVLAFATAGVVLLAGVGVATVALLKKPDPSAVVAPEPVDEHARMREQFLAGEEVVIVPEKGLPKWHEWVIGQADITDSPVMDGSAYLRPFGIGAVNLFYPPEPSYRVSVDLLHQSAQDHLDENVTEIGLLLFHQRAATPTGAWLDSFMRVSYRDWDVGVWKKRPPAPQNVKVTTEHQYVLKPKSPPAGSQHEFSSSVTRFTTGTLPPGEWRRIVAEVCPDRVRLFWDEAPDQPKSESKLVAVYTTDVLNAEYRSHQRAIASASPFNRIDATLVPQAWTPTGGVGLWAVRSGLAFRNFTVRRYSP